MKRLILFIAALWLALLAPVAHAQGLSIIRDEEIEQTIKIFSTPIWKEAGLSPQTVDIILVQDSSLNAFVAGGQNIFIHTGLLLETESPEELAGVIAHESGHIASGHLLRMHAEMETLSAQAMLARILGIAVAIGTKSSGAGAAISSAGETTALRQALRHSRVQETAADQAGVRFLQDAGLPVSGFLGFMQKLASQELLPESQQSEYVRTHPLAQDRVDFLAHMAASAPRKDVPSKWNALHGRMKMKLLGFLYPERALTQKGTDANTRYAKAIAHYRKGRIDKSLEMMNVLLGEEPDNPYFHELKGQVLFEQGRIQESLPAYKRAVELAPSSGLIRASYGHAQLEAKQLTGAIDSFEAALRKEPRQARTHHLLAIAYGKNGQEGFSRLHLAEEALLQGKADFARTEANLALAKLPKDAPAAQRARDILDVVERADKKKKKG